MAKTRAVGHFRLVGGKLLCTKVLKGRITDRHLRAVEELIQQARKGFWNQLPTATISAIGGNDVGLADIEKGVTFEVKFTFR